MALYYSAKRINPKICVLRIEIRAVRTDCIHEYRRRGLIYIQPLPNDVRAALLCIARGFVALLLTALI